MPKEFNFVSTWQETIGLDVLYSIGKMEDYGGHQIVNQSFAFIAGRTEEFCEDYILYPMAGKNPEIQAFLELLERIYILSVCDGVESFGKHILDLFRHTPGTIKKVADGWPKILGDIDKAGWYNPDCIKAVVGEKTPKGFVPIFQSRMSWRITCGSFCERCGYEGTQSHPDYSCHVRGRFGFGFIPKEFLLTRKTILFRKFK